MSEVKRKLPEGWQWVKLDDVCEKPTGIRNPKNAPEIFFQYVDITSVNNVLKCITEARMILGNNAPSRARQIIRTNDVIVSTTRPNLNSVAQVPSELDNQICSTGFCVLRAGSSIHPDYLFAFVRHPLFIESLADLVKGALYPAVTDSQVRAQVIPLPPLAEQRRIAGLLKEQMAAVEAARAAAEERLRAVRALPAAFLRQVFGDDPVFTASPVTPVRHSKAGWVWHRLTDIARLATGHTPSRYHPEYWKGDIPWLQLADIRELDGHEVFDTSEHTNELGIDNSSAVLLPKGTVCMSRTASVGFFTIMGCQIATSQDFVNWVCGDALDPWFLMYLLIANRKRIRDLGSGAVHQTIYFPTVQAFSVCVPDIDKQRQLANKLREQMSEAEKAQTAAEAELEIINSLPAALLCRAFNGEL